MPTDSRHNAPPPPPVPLGAPPAGERRHGCGCLALLGGVMLVLVGIPMLVLPGPGIAAIIGGFALIARGLRGRPGRA
ncbi:MAG: hypothetical protein U1E29_03790 [Coriobacteriia bacterium]|nr:hypothetical protein [Coriobacteriia bacterium]